MWKGYERVDMATRYADNRAWNTNNEVRAVFPDRGKYDEPSYVLHRIHIGLK